MAAGQNSSLATVRQVKDGKGNAIRVICRSGPSGYLSRSSFRSRSGSVVSLCLSPVRPAAHGIHFSLGTFGNQVNYIVGRGLFRKSQTLSKPHNAMTRSQPITCPPPWQQLVSPAPKHEPAKPLAPGWLFPNSASPFQAPPLPWPIYPEPGQAECRQCPIPSLLLHL